MSTTAPSPVVQMLSQLPATLTRQTLQAAEERADVTRLFLQLRPIEREVLYLRHVLGQSERRVASELGMSRRRERRVESVAIAKLEEWA